MDLGSGKDAAVANTIRDRINPLSRPNCHVLAGKTNLYEAIDLMALAGRVIANDSGLMHVAAALNRPLIGVYGSTSPLYTPPLADRVGSSTPTSSAAPASSAPASSATSSA